MKKIAVCFTTSGEAVIEQLNRALEQKGIEPAIAYTSKEDEQKEPGFNRISEPLGQWTASVFQPGNALIFVGAIGIAVRAVSGLAKDKLSDSPVIVCDSYFIGARGRRK